MSWIALDYGAAVSAIAIDGGCLSAGILIRHIRPKSYRRPLLFLIPY
jgi:hypothetical protein